MKVRFAGSEGHTKKRMPGKGAITAKPAAKGPNTHSKAGSTIAGITILLLLGIIIYSNSFECSFQYDDLYAIVHNPKIRDLADFSTVWNSRPDRPVAFLTFAVNYHFSEYEVHSWHLVNLIIHLVNTILVGALTLLIFATPAMKDQKIAGHKRLLAFLTALLFVSHPLATQSVTYIIQRMTSLAALFYLFSIVLYLRARLSDRSMILKILLFAASLLSGFLAIRTKENAFTLPLTILLIEFFFLRTRNLSACLRDRRVILILALFLGATAYLALSRFSLNIFKPISPEGHPEDVLTPYFYFLTQFKVIVKYIGLLFLPVGQNLDYSFPVSTALFQKTTFLCFLILVSLIILAIFLFNKHRIISFGIVWFFLTLSIESSVIPLNDVIVEHRTYLPSVGFFLVVISSLYTLLWKKSRLIVVGILVIVSGTNACLAYERNKVWKDDLSLWSDVVLKSPGKARSITNRGIAYANRGQWELAIDDYSRSLQIDSIAPIGLISRGFAYKHLGQYEKAAADYSRAIAIDPKNIIAYSNRGICYANLGKTGMAIEDFTRAIELDPGRPDAYSNRSAVFLETGQVEKAMNDINKAISFDPDHSKAISNRGAIYERLEQWDKAIADYSKAIEFDPESAQAYINRATVLMKSGLKEKALADYSRAISMDPGHKEAFFNRGVINENLGRWDQAIDDFSQAIKLDPGDKMGYYNRGMTFGKMGRLEMAIEDFTAALKIDPGFSSALMYREVAYRKIQAQKRK